MPSEKATLTTRSIAFSIASRWRRTVLFTARLSACAERKMYKDNRKGAMMAALKIRGPCAKIQLAKARKKWDEILIAAEECSASIHGMWIRFMIWVWPQKSLKNLTCPFGY